MMRLIVFAGVMCLSAWPVHADCIEDIRAAFRESRDPENMRVYGETVIGGVVIQKTNGWYKDFGNGMFEVIGRNWWSMARLTRSIATAT